jgi:cell wall-associated NlpC family hydrolase
MTAWWGKYIGLPYADAHCWELVRRVYQDRMGVDLPSYGEVSARDLVKVARTMADGAAGDGWLPVAIPQALDVALMRGRHHVWHVGVMVDPANVLHTEIATGAVVVPVSHPMVRGRITGFRRYAG